MKTILFADIDGVFHDADAVAIEIVGDTWRATGENLFCWAACLWEAIASYDVDIVFHSTWRYHHSVDEIRRLFPEAMRPRISDVTGAGGRLESIRLYIEEHNVARFVVLDDAPAEFPPQWPHLIACDPRRGLSDPEVTAGLTRFLADGAR